MKKNVLAALIAVAIVGTSPVMAVIPGGFNISAGQTVTTPQILNSGQYGLIESGSSVLISTGATPVTIAGDSVLLNEGLISGQGDSALVANSTSNGDWITNTGMLTATGNSAAVLSINGTWATIINRGTITATSGTWAVDLGSGGNFEDTTLTIQGSSAQINGNITGSSETQLIVDLGPGNSFNYSGIISNGMSVVMDSGQTTFNGINTYSGGTTILGGALVLGNSNAAGTGTITLGGGTLVYRNGENVTNPMITFTGWLEVDSNDAATQSGIISGIGSLIKTGSGTLTLTGANTYVGGTTVAAGTLQGDSNSLQGNIVDNATLSFQQNTVGTYAGNITGTGALSVSGSSMLILDGNSTLGGGTTIQSGTLEVGDGNTPSASLGGAVNVLTNGTLRGHGTINGNVLNGGTVWPGGSIGTLSIQGNYTQTSGGTLNIDATPNGQSSLLAVSGTATIQGGSAVVLAQNGSWSPRTDYTILTAGQGITGEFSSATSSLPFLIPVLSYGSNGVTLSLERNDITFSSVTQTPNQLATADAAKSLGWNSAVYNTLVLTDVPTAQQAFNQLSGQIYASTLTALMDNSRYIRDAINGHLLGFNNGANGLDATGDNGITAWTSGWGHWGANNGDDNASRLQANGSGLLIGADLPVENIARVGVVAGSGQNSARVGALDSSSHTTATDLGIYGSIHAGQFQLLGAAAYAWQSVSSNRAIDFNNFSGLESSHYDADTSQTYLDGSYTFAIARNQISPYFNVAHVLVQSATAHESAGAAALDINASSTSVTYATLGIRGVFALDTHGDIRAHAGLGWQNAWGTINPTNTMQFQSGSTMFDISGVPIARRTGVADIGLSMAVAPSFSADVSYSGQFAGRAKDQAARMSLSWAF